MTQLYSFIPKRLNIKDREELNNFPYNILICSFRADTQNKVIEGSVIYLPDIETYKKTDISDSLAYFNYMSPGYFFKIWYFRKTGLYKGEKYANYKVVSVTTGNNWKSFFFQLGMIGLSDGEKCELKLKPLNHIWRGKRISFIILYMSNMRKLFEWLREEFIVIKKLIKRDPIDMEQVYRDMNEGRRPKCSQFEAWKKSREYLNKLN